MNKHRGEMIVEVDGKEYQLVPTFEALAEIEARSGMGIIRLAHQMWENNARVVDLAAIIYGGVLGHLEPKTIEDMPWTFRSLQELVVKQGVFKLVPECLEFITEAVSGQSKEEQAGKKGISTDSEQLPA